MSVKQAFGLLNGKIVHISQVVSGLSCNCLCLGCGCKLIAKKRSTAHHFAHRPSSECTYHPETALHKYAKKLLMQQEIFVAPSLLVTVHDSEYGKSISHALPERSVAINMSMEEKAYMDVTPDIQLHTEEGIFFIEIAVTHFVDKIKREKLKRIGLPTIEINLSDLPKQETLETIRNTILSSLLIRSWIFHPQESEIRRNLKRELTEKTEKFVNCYESYRHENYKKTDSEVLADKVKGYDAKAVKIRKELSLLPKTERVTKYMSLSNTEQLALHFNIIGGYASTLPSFYTNEPMFEKSVFECPPILWRTGVYIHWVMKNKKEFSLRSVVNWTTSYYPLVHHTKNQLDTYELSSHENEIFEFLESIVSTGQLQSDGWAAKFRTYFINKPRQTK